MTYHETPTYRRLVAEAGQKFAALEAERFQLRNIKPKMRTPEQRRRFTNLAVQIKTKLRQLQEVYRLDVSMWWLLRMLIEMEGEPWTDVELEFWNKVLAHHEGKGEQGCKRRRGLPEASGNGDGDLVRWINGIRVIYEEVKNLQAKDQQALQDIQTGRHGTKAFAAWVVRMIKGHKFDDLPDDVVEACVNGEVTNAVLDRLPTEVRSSLHEALRPSVVLGTYQAINCGTCDGVMRIPSCDFDQAWEYSSVSKHGPKYSLKREYLLARLQRVVLPYRIGLVAMAAKPYHGGHHGLIALAARQNDKVHLYVSLSDRDNVSGETMRQAWKKLIEPTLPANVEVTYGGSPVGHVFAVLGDAEQLGSRDVYTVYSDPHDLWDAYKTLDRYAGNLKQAGRIILRAVGREETVNVSGTAMRSWLAVGDKESFVRHLPAGLDGDAYWDLLRNSPVPVSTASAAE